MLLPYTTLEYYGPGAGAMVLGDAGGSLASMQPRGSARMAAQAQGAGVIHYLRPIRLRGFPMLAAGYGQLHAMQPHMSARMALDVKIGTLTAGDVEGAVLESRIDGDLTLKQALRLLLAVAAGNASGLESGPAVSFRSLDGGKVRVAGTIAAGTRTITARDGE